MKRLALFFLTLAAPLSANGASRDFAKLEAKVPGLAQLFLVKASKTPQSEAELWQKTKGAWKRLERFPVVVGRAGTIAAAQKREGDGHTPEGLYALSQLFGRTPAPQAKVPFVLLTQEDKWIDDPEHKDYNKWIRGETSAKSFETLVREDEQYDRFFVVDYNMSPVVPGKGSAIFVHLWSSGTKGTAGCVAMERKNIEKLVSILDEKSKPHILIGSLDSALAP